MKKIIAIQSNKLNEINIETDTTFLLALEAQKKGYQIIWYETKDLFSRPLLDIFNNSFDQNNKFLLFIVVFNPSL